MLPLSLGRAPTLTGERRQPTSSAWLRPVNIASGVSAELRALVTWLALFVAIGVVIALGHVWLRLKVVDQGYRLSATAGVLKKLEQERQTLTLEVETLSTSGRLGALAQARLGLVRPGIGQEAVLP